MPRPCCSVFSVFQSVQFFEACACLGARERSERVTGRRQPPRQRSRRLVSKTVGKNAKAIQEYVANQLKTDKEADQLSIFDPRDPLTGSK